MEGIDGIKFTVPLKINSKLSLNRIYGGIHWAQRKKQAQKIHEATELALLSQNVPKKMFERPVDVVFRWNSKLDLDNHAYVAKMILDTLKGYLIHDDTKKFVSSIKHEYHEKTGVSVVISAQKSNEVKQDEKQAN